MVFDTTELSCCESAGLQEWQVSWSAEELPWGLRTGLVACTSHCVPRVIARHQVQASKSEIMTCISPSHLPNSGRAPWPSGKPASEGAGERRALPLNARVARQLQGTSRGTFQSSEDRRGGAASGGGCSAHREPTPAPGLQEGQLAGLGAALPGTAGGTAAQIAVTLWLL